MRVVFSSVILWTAISAGLLLAAILLVRLGWITSATGRRRAIAMASLVSACAFAVRPEFVRSLEQSILDAAVLFAVLWFWTFFVAWAGIAFGVRRFHGRVEHADSSILSMQYMESRQQVDGSGQLDRQFQETVMMSRDSMSDAASGGPVSVKSGQGEEIKPVRH